MGEHALAAEERNGTGKSVTRKLRAAGRIPGVLYGKGKDSQNITLDPRALERLLTTSGSGMNTLIDLSFGGAETTVLVKEIQRDPVKGAYLHADLFELDLQKRVEVNVPIHFVGKAQGTDFGGILDHSLRELHLECLPTAIPDAIEVDVSALDVGDSLHVRDITVPAGVNVLTDLELGVASVVTPKAAEEETTEVEGAEEGAEPEAEGAAEAPDATEGE